jgi:hypothetical protein
MHGHMMLYYTRFSSDDHKSVVGLILAKQARVASYISHFNHIAYDASAETLLTHKTRGCGMVKSHRLGDARERA